MGTSSIALLRIVAALILLAATGTGCRPSPEPSASLATETIPPPRELYLSTLTPRMVTVGNAELGVGVYPWTDGPAVRGRVIRTHEITYAYGLIAHAPSRLVYGLDGQFQRFHTEFSLQSGVACGDGVIFQVFLDEQIVYSSDPVLSETDPQAIELDVSGYDELVLVADALDDTGCDWAIWGNPYLLGGSVVADSYPTRTVFPTPTPNPDLPCGGVMPERVYLFLDCSDILRMRANLNSGSPEFRRYWDHLVSVVNEYRQDFPNSYDPNYSFDVLWWGPGNYMARDMAIIYLVTGDRGMLRDVVRLLDLVYANTPQTSYLVNYDQPALNTDRYAGGLLSHPRYGEIVFQSVLFAYLAVRDSLELNDMQRRQFDEFFINQAHLLEEAAIQKGNTIPVTSWLNRNNQEGANVAALTIALAFPEDAGLQQVSRRVASRLEWQLANWWHVDGGWGEDTYWYASRVLEGLILYAESVYKNTGQNIYTADFGGRSIHSMCTFFLASVTPEGDPPPVNDTAWFFFDPGTLLLCSQRTGDPQLQYAAQRYLQGLGYAYGITSLTFTLFETVAWWDPQTITPVEEPLWTSVLLPDSGLGIFRSDWSPEAQYGLLKYTSSAVHAHYSFGDFFLYDHGPWLIGNGYHLGDDYARSVHTRSSSTLTLDDAQQTSLGGELVAFIPLEQTGYMAVTSSSYSTLTHTRSVFWNQTWHQWLVVDDAALSTSPAGHALQVRWYVRGDIVSHDENGDWIFDRPEYPGILSIQMPASVQATYSPIERSFEFNQFGNAQGVEMQIFPATPSTRLVTVLTYSEARSSSTSYVQRDDSGQGLIMTLQPKAESPVWYWLLPARGSMTMETPEYLLQGRAGCVWESQTGLAGYCLFDGSRLSADGLLLMDSSVPLSLEVDIEQDYIRIDAHQAAMFRFHWPETVSELILDGDFHPFSVQDGLIVVELPPGQYTLEVK